MVVRFRCVLKDGSEVVGPIMGNGGMLGDICAHLSESMQQAVAKDVLKFVVRRLRTADKQHRIYEPAPNYCAVYPNYSAESDGDPVAVNLLATKFEVVR